MSREARAIVVVGLLYGAVGVVTGAVAAAVSSSRAQTAWRLSAWVISAFLLAAHVAFERVRLGHPIVRSAWHVALAAALGGFALAAAANVHDLGAAAGYRPRMLVALVAWPLITAVPGFLAALAGAAVLGLARPRGGG